MPEIKAPPLHCPDCQRKIEGVRLICQACLEKKSRQVYLELQKPFLSEVLAGRSELTMTAPAASTRWHIRLAGEPTHAFCGEKVSPRWFKKYQKLDGPLLVCERCDEVMTELFKEMEVERLEREVKCRVSG